MKVDQVNNTKLLSVKVIAKAREAEGIASFELARADGAESADGASLPPFTAGAHIDVHMGDGLVRQYSLCNAPGERHRYLIAVLRDPASRGGSAAMHDRVQVGDVLQISEPKNHFALVPAPHQLLLAGGIGVTPILCMAEALSQQAGSFEMHYCSRSPERTAFQARIAASPFAGQVQFHHDDGPAAQPLDAARVLAHPRPGTHLYVCGPAGFISHVLETARSCGWGEAQLHREFFAAAPTAATVHAADGPFEVRLASSGKTYTIPATTSVTEALAAQGVEIPVSCEAGVCGTCLTRVLAGEPDHRDVFLTEAEQARNDQFTPCCSRAKGPLLVLDL